jgi:hypothetical protein
VFPQIGLDDLQTREAGNDQQLGPESRAATLHRSYCPFLSKPDEPVDALKLVY